MADVKVIPQEAGKHGFEARTRFVPQQQTFSVGVFEMVPRKGSSGGVRRSRAKVRVHGHVSQCDAVVAHCHEVVKLLDAGVYKGKALVWV